MLGLRIKLAEALYDDLVDLPIEQRASLLTARCAGDDKLCVLVERLLNNDDSDLGSFLCRPDLTPEQPPVPPLRIGRYEIIGEIGRGGAGVVYEARQENPRRHVALKVIGAGLTSPELLRRFAHEAEILGHLQHPGIAQVFEAGTAEARSPLGIATTVPYFAMELVRGELVTRYCDRERLSLTQRLALFHDICGAVQHAHQKGVIHRDLKPSNILVTLAAGMPLAKVIDFGIAKMTAPHLNDRTLVTELHQLIGTPQYMSPEQADASGDIDTRSDIYSLGVLLYELLAGTTPLDSNWLRSIPFSEVLRIIREEDPPKPSLRLTTLAPSSETIRLQSPALQPPGAAPADSSVIEIAQRRHTELYALIRVLRGDLDWIVMKCLEKDRRRRYETASALADDVARFLAHEPVTATPPRAGYKLRKFLRRNRTYVLAGSLVVSALLIAVIGTTAGLLWALRERVQATQQRENAERVAGYMADMLKGVKSAKARGRDTTVLREMLDGVAQRIDAGELKDSPDAEFHLRVTLGGAYQDIADDGATQRAESILRPAPALAERTYGLQSAEAARSRQYLASTMITLGRPDDALILYEAALKIRRALFPGDHPATATTLNGLAHCLVSLGRPADALANAQDGLEMRQRLYTGDHADVAGSLNNVAACLDTLGRPAEALPNYEAALQMRRRLFRGDHPDLAESLNNSALCLSVLGRLSEALPLHEEALEMYARLFHGRDHPNLAYSLNNVAYCHKALGRSAEALPSFEAALHMRQRLFKGDHPDIAVSLNNVASCLVSLGRADEARPLHEAALAMYRRQFTGDQPIVANTMNNLAACLNSLGRWAEALPHAQAASEMNRRMLPPDHLHILLSETHQGCALANLDRFSEAEPLLLGCAAKLVGRRDANARQKQRALDAVASLYEAWHAAEPAQGYDAKAAEWHAKLAEYQASTQPVTQPAADAPTPRGDSH